MAGELGFIQDLPAGAGSAQDIPDDFRPGPIGRRSDLIRAIAEVVPSADFSDPSWGIIRGDGFSIEVSMGSDEIVDCIVGLFEADPGEKDALWIPGRLFLRVSRVAAACELHTLPLLGGSDPVRLGRLQCDLLPGELAFVAGRLHDPLAIDVVRSVSEYLASRLRRPAWDGFVTVEGEQRGQPS